MLNEECEPPAWKWKLEPDGTTRPYTKEPPASSWVAPSRRVGAHSAPTGQVAGKSHTRPAGVTLYDYSPTQRVRREDDGAGTKIVRPQHLNAAGKWEIGDGPGEKQHVYRRDDLTREEWRGDIVAVVEGENVADLLREQGFLAVTFRGGAGRVAAAIPQLLDGLTGRDVVLLPDGDKPGREAMRTLAAALYGKAARLRVCTLYDDDSKRDAEDFFAEGFTADDLTARMEAAPDYVQAADDDDAGQRRFTTYTAGEMMHRPPMEFVIDGMVPKNSFVTLIAPPKTLKTFFALDIALCIASGRTWNGRETKHAPTLYVSAEGAAGIGQRIRAWCEAHYATPPDNFRVITDAPQLLDDEHVDALIATAKEEPPALIVLDTLARTFAGEENSAKEMGAYVRAVDRIRRETGAAVIVVHHTNKGGLVARGSSALLGAVDVEIALARDGETLTATITAVKDFPEGEPMLFTAKAVALEGGGSSLVLEKAITAAGDLGSVAKKVLAVLVDTFGDEGATATAWKTAVESSGLDETAFYRARTELERAGCVAPPPPNKKRGHRYRLATAKTPLF